MRLYRYRNIDRGKEELLSQKIFFADRELLNDPMEGYAQVYWHGDEIAWQGLFSNYICSVDMSITRYSLRCDEASIKETAALVDIHSFDDVPYGDRLNDLRNEFIKNERIRKLLSLLGTISEPIERYELKFILGQIHNYAFALCVRSQIKNNLTPDITGELLEFTYRLEKMSDFSFCEELLKSKKAIRQKIVRNHDNFPKKIDSLSSKYDARDRAWNAILSDFPGNYIEKIVDMIHHTTYIACFSLSQDSSPMWGHYAENHKGICIIYETSKKNGKDVIPFTNKYPMEIRKVNYGTYTTRMNFFTMLGRLNRKQISSWLNDEKGTESSCAREMYDDEDAWRNMYWDFLYDRYSNKPIDWKYEQEYRLIFPDFMYEYEGKDENGNKKKVLFEYDFASIKGVIFGIRTTWTDKMEIKDILEDKCRKQGLNMPEFYQAECDEMSNSIHVNRINGI